MSDELPFYEVPEVPFDEVPVEPGPGLIEQIAIAAGYGEGHALTTFRLGYAHRGRYGAKGENAGISAGDMAAYMAGLEARLAFDAQLAADRQP